MKKILVLLSLFIVPLSLSAGIITYTFTSAKWASTPSGWTSDKDAYGYTPYYTDAQGLQYGGGVSVKKTQSGAGATSNDVFTDVRRITFNFSQNKSGGKGVIYVQVGSNTPDSIVVVRPTDGKGDYTRDSMITFATPQTGKIKFWIKCTENAINMNMISIRSASGGSSVFNMPTYQLVTDVNQLQDSDQVIFGVHKDGVNYIMGYFDEWNSVNNIYAIKGRYSADRSTVEEDESAVYTLRITELDGKKAFIFQDELRYEEAYLVASGGQTKNRLALWTDIVDKNTYGNYGYWDIAIENGGEAVITNKGNSKSKIIQYNASNNPTIFACYADRSQTPVCLYRRVEATGDVAAIVAPFVNFGTTIKQSDKRTITINANKLTQDITATLVKGDIFQLSTVTLDRDGDALTISYSDIAAAGHFIDTLVLQSGSIEKRVAILLNRINPLTVKEAVKSEDHAIVYLNDVTVTKKYDNYIYVRDETGSMLLFDRGDGVSGKRYGADVKAGNKLSGVTGRFINYFGVPEISPTEKFNFTKDTEVEPETAPADIDSADVCRYLVLENAVVHDWTSLTYNGKKYAVLNKFNLSAFTKDVPTRTFVIVSYDHDVVTLYIVKQENATGIENNNFRSAERRLIMRDGIIMVETEKGLYTLQGEKIL